MDGRKQVVEARYVVAPSTLVSFDLGPYDPNLPLVIDPVLTSFRGATDAFVARFDPFATGAASLVYCTYLGGTGLDIAFGIAVAPASRRTGESASPARHDLTTFQRLPALFPRTSRAVATRS